MVNKAIRIVIVVSGILNWIVLIRNAFDGFHYVHKSQSRHASWVEMVRVQKRNYSDHHLLHFQSCSDLPVQTERLRRPYVSTISLIDLHKKYHAGVDGHFSPPNCVTKEKIAIIVPLHGRLDGCFILLNNLIPVLKNQNKDFSIFVIEQVSDAPFNKALLMNAGFVEAIKQDVFTCFIFHDEDLIPVTNSVPYECPFNQLHHLSVNVSSFNHTVQEHRVGGVVAMTSQLFKSVNGFSNLYFGHGYEVQDMFQRLKALNISTVDARKRDGIFVRIGDTGNRANIRNEDGLKLLDAVSRRPQHEGLNTLKVSVGLPGRMNVANVLTRKQISFDADYYLKQIDAILKKKSFPLN
ncbi:beta-N-acetyl-D-glucosaminide beta-1,4-N-acetylglucosaminyl-transferase-like [Haliotis rufescens]|uniref:beta-N-acetyl-D-glucosaminide beta-1,4-N-acetylglucosaminyl-transferase-like n=1 Tax=Haliotis rufescens TaxID=6454 RepID=UPI00201ED212|nr:beta-N-acetyl-D-glucosaminide beta-1,4-N-acetylglucosaminyl-transferase-like [Haliotis rufescens]